MAKEKIEQMVGGLTSVRSKDTHPKMEEFYERYKDLVHLKKDGTKEALCNSKGAVRFSDDLRKVTCRSCRNRAERS